MSLSSLKKIYDEMTEGQGAKKFKFGHKTASFTLLYGGILLAVMPKRSWRLDALATIAMLVGGAGGAAGELFLFANENDLPMEPTPVFRAFLSKDSVNRWKRLKGVLTHGVFLTPAVLRLVRAYRNGHAHT